MKSCIIFWIIFISLVFSSPSRADSPAIQNIRISNSPTHLTLRFYLANSFSPKIEEAITKAKKALEGDDIDAIKKSQDELMNVSHKLAEAMYAKTSGGQGGPETGAGGGSQQAGPEQASGKKDDDVVDADFEDVK